MINSFLTATLATTTQETAIEETTKLAESNEEAVENVANRVSTLFDTIEKYKATALEFFLSLLIAVLILIIGRIIIKFIMKMVDRIFGRFSMDISAKRFLHSLINVTCYMVLVVILLQVVGVQTTSFVAILGSAGVAIGLAMQGTLSNVAGGVLIMIVKPFRVGDYIKEEMNNGVEGTVNRIDIFYTHLTTIDNQVIMIPNGTLINSRIVNVTKNQNRRIDFQIGVSYQQDIKQAKEVMWQVIDEIKEVVETEEKTVFVKELGDSAVTMEARFWVPTDKYWSILFYVNEEMLKRFHENGIEVPYNQLDVHVVKE